jgi:16S rRNA pseudouridine516 synthase
LPRIDRSVARHLGLSRQEAAARFRARRIVDLTGRVLAGDEHLAADALVLLDGAPLQLVEHVHVLLHKPIGCVTALSDPLHATAAALVADAPCAGDLRPIGRLDLDTSGLLLWTTDGARVQRWAHPRRAVARTYQAALSRPFARSHDGLVLRDGTRPDITDLRALQRDEVHRALAIPREATELATITIRSGAYHEVRRIFAALGSEVVGLARVAFGPFALPADLAPGAWRAIDLPADPPAQ